jgi:hypothetical protein
VLRGTDPAKLEGFYLDVLRLRFAKLQEELTELRVASALIDIVPANGWRPIKHRRTNKHVRIKQSLEPRYGRKPIFHLTVSGVNQCADLGEELLAFPKAPNDDASDSAAYQIQIAQPTAGGRVDADVAETRRRLTQNQSRQLPSKHRARARPLGPAAERIAADSGDPCVPIRSACKP